MKSVYIKEIEVRYRRRKAPDKATTKPLTDPAKVISLFSDMQNETKEKLVTISLDSKMKILCYEIVAIGQVNCLLTRKMEILRSAVLVNAIGIIMVHNHPSGDPSPNSKDNAFTKNLDKACHHLDLILYDHIIVGDDSYYSYAEKRKIKP